MMFVVRVHVMWDHGAFQEFCIEYFDTDDLRKAYTLTMFLLYYIIPLVIIAACYYFMARNLKFNTNLGNCRSSSRPRSRRRKVAKIVLVVVTTFALCWLPIHVVHLCTDFGPTTLSDSFYVVKIIAHVMSYVNSTINPVIYSFMSECFRECFWNACQCCKRPSAVTCDKSPDPKKPKRSLKKLVTPPKPSCPIEDNEVNNDADDNNSDKRVEYKHTLVSTAGKSKQDSASLVMTTVIQLENFNIADSSYSVNELQVTEL